MSGLKSSFSRLPKFPRAWLQVSVSREVVLVCCIAAPLALLLMNPAVVSDAWFHASVFQSIALVFLAVLAFRQLLQAPRQAARPPVPVGPESGSRSGVLPALLAAALAYAASLTLSFNCDDFEHLALIREPFRLSIWPQFTRGQFDGQSYIFYRPLGFASLFTDYRIWREWAPGYHMTNLLFHLLAVAGVYFLCRELGLQKRACSAAAVIFALLPVNVQAVTWIGCRFDLLASVFGVWALVCVLRSRRTGRLALYCSALALFVLAVLSKESAYAVALLWLPLAVMPTAGGNPQPSHLRRTATLAGYLLVPALMWLLRYHILGGVGGYHYIQDGRPLAGQFGAASLAGIILRAPAEALFGYNWLQQGAWPVALPAAVTASLLLCFGALASRNAHSRRVTALCLLWVPIAALPAHFYFQRSDPSLFYSRSLYFASMGMAILIAVAFTQALADSRSCRNWTFALALLLAYGVQHNLVAWRNASKTTDSLFKNLHRAYPNPPRNATFHLRRIPSTQAGVPVFTVGLQNAVRSAYSWRTDLYARQAEYEVNPPDASETELYISFP
jgi:hypothetical protein